MAARSLSAARRAFESGDVDESRRAHRTPTAQDLAERKDSSYQEPTEAGHSNGVPPPLSMPQRAWTSSAGGGTTVITETGHACGDTTLGQCALWGGLDGAASSCCLLAACGAAGLPSETVWRLWAAGVAGFFLARIARDYLRYATEAAVYKREREREEWELRNYPDGEAAEMVELYEAKGVAKRSAEVAIRELRQFPAFFVELMMVQELRLQEPDTSAPMAAAATGAGFALMALLPAAAFEGYRRSTGALAAMAARGLASSDSPASKVVANLLSAVRHPLPAAFAAVLVPALLLAGARAKLVPLAFSIKRQRSWTAAWMTAIIAAAPLAAWAAFAAFSGGARAA